MLVGEVEVLFKTLGGSLKLSEQQSLHASVLRGECVVYLGGNGNIELKLAGNGNY